ncbi:MAG: tail fiber domain-containing protein [Bacteroidia bacterium]
MIIDSAGNVGIGTVAPERLFHVMRTASDGVNGSVLNSYEIAQFKVIAGGGAKRGLEIGAPTGSIGSPVYLKVHGTSNRFAVLNQSDVEHFTILDGGNVGIGTNNPTMKLDILSGALNSGIRLRMLSTDELWLSSDAFGNYYEWNSTTAAKSIIRLQTRNSGAGNYVQFFLDAGNQNIRFNTKGAERMQIDSLGNVGIGTTGPTTKLHIIENTVLTNKLILDNTFANNRGSIISFFKNGTQIAGVGIRGTIEGNTNTGLGLFADGSSNGIHFYTGGSGTAKAIIDSLGNVGVGTTNPVSKLTVSRALEAAAYQGEFRVEGGISDGNYDGIRFTQGATGATPLAGIRVLYHNNGQPDMGFYLRDGGASEGQKMVILNNGDIGIGTTSPNAKLDVQGTLRIGHGNTAGYQFTEAADDTYMKLSYYNTSTNELTPNIITTTYTGLVGIGTLTPSQALHVVGSICYTGGIGACSDNRYKRNVTPIPDALNKVLQMNGVYYYWKTEEFPNQKFSENKQIGFIAQDLEKLYPELVFTDKDGYKSVDYSRLTPVLVEAVKELNSKNQELQKLINMQQLLYEQQQKINSTLQDSNKDLKVQNEILNSEIQKIKQLLDLETKK